MRVFSPETTMKIKQIHHVAYRCIDAKQTVEWYLKHLNMDFVLAIGYPANIGQSVTSGIVSGLHRTNVGVEQFENFIQTDAAIYPGNSGGALVDLQGDLVGINTAFIGATSTNPGMGFAIPVNTARIIADQIIEFGDVRRGTLGISSTTVAGIPHDITDLYVVPIPKQITSALRGGWGNDARDR